MRPGNQLAGKIKLIVRSALSILTRPPYQIRFSLSLEYLDKSDVNLGRPPPTVQVEARAGEQGQVIVLEERKVYLQYPEMIGGRLRHTSHQRNPHERCWQALVEVGLDS